MFRPGTGHRFHPSRLATRVPANESINGHSSNPMTTTGGMTIAVMSSGPSFRNWNRKRKYQSGRGMVTARGSAGCSSWRFFCTNAASRPTVMSMITAMIG